MDAVDRLFAEFELVYHNQYLRAFPSAEKLRLAKQIWFSHLERFSAERILAAAHRAIRESEFLPTIASLVKYCENDWEIYGLPDPRTAFIEACMAPNPKANHPWSHPAVFHAGQATDWFFLATQEERRTFPVFERYYRTLCERVRQGEKLEAPVPLALPEPTPQPLAREELQKQLDAIRKELNQ
jgi:hypothetical protein